MDNPYEVGGLKSLEQFRSPRDRVWKFLWLLSYVSPFVLETVILVCYPNDTVAGFEAALLIFGPFALGILGAISSFVYGRLSVPQIMFGTLATMLAFLVGFLLFAFLLALAFGVVAT